MGRQPLRRCVAALAAMLVFAGTAPASAEEESLFIAAREGHLDVVKRHLDAGVDPNHDDKSWTPLQVAASSGRLDVVNLLLAHKADPHHRDGSRQTPLHSAVYSGHADVVRALLAAKAQVDARDYAENTPLLVAARYGRAEIVRILLAAGADPKATDHIGETALRNGALARSAEVVGLLLAAGTPVDAGDRILLETPLLIASTYGATDVVEKLLAAGADVNAQDSDGHTPLWNAAQQGHATVVARLLAKGADPGRPHEGGWSPFVVAAGGGHREVARLLVDRTPDLGPALVEAAGAGFDELVARLLARKADPNVVNRMDHSALGLAARRGYLAIVDALLAAGADVKRHGTEAMHEAAGGNAVSVLRRLLEKGVPVDARDASNATPLLRAVGPGSLEAVELLLAHGADRKPVDAHGRGVEDFMRGNEGIYTSDLDRMHRSRAAPIRAPEVEGLLRALRERHAKIRELLAKPAK